MSATDLLALFDGLRVADVRDGMDWAGQHASKAGFAGVTVWRGR